VSRAKKTELHVGTSGWTYDGWRGSFYPEDIPKRCWLEHYASVFNSAEINGSFYRTPSLEAVRLEIGQVVAGQVQRALLGEQMTIR